MALHSPQVASWRRIACCFFVFGLCLSAFVAWWPVTDPVDLKARVPGVAFSLTPDYGTAAIYFGNETFTTIGPIEGDAQYMDFMRRNLHSPAMGWHKLCDGLPSSLGLLKRALCPRDPDMDAVQGLLKTLKQSVASRLGTTFCFAEIILPDPQNQDYQRQIVEEALARLDLRRLFPTLNAAKMAIVANALGEHADPNFDAQVVLAVDHSTYGLNVALVSDEDGIIASLRQRYSIGLAAKEASSPQRWEEVKSIVAEITKTPFGQSILKRPLPEKIQSLVVYGDMTNVSTLNTSLKAILGQDVVDSALRFEPLFASAISAARNSHDMMREIHFPERPSLWCACRSKLYSDERFEL